VVEFLSIYWAKPESAIFLPLIATAIFFLIHAHFKALSNIFTLCHKNNIGFLFQNFSINKLTLKTGLKILAAIFLTIALFQPQWGRINQTVNKKGRDILILLDVSRSMACQDLSPSRLEFAKLKIKSFLRRLEFDRVGLILFSGLSILHCPLTQDHSAFAMFLDEIDSQIMSSGTTAIDKALEQAIATYQKFGPNKNKIVLLVSDGQDFSSNLEKIKKQAKQVGINIATIGIGTSAGAPIPIINHQGQVTGYEKSEGGTIELSKLEEPFLKNLSTNLNGFYTKATYDDLDLDIIAKHIENFEKETLATENQNIYKDKYPFFAAAFWLALALEWII
jgi:Ca-activated chloride channel homolog